MVDKNLQSKINESLNFGEMSSNIRKNVINFRYTDSYSMFDYYKKDYSLKEINDFFLDNKKLLFKKGKKFEHELYNNWSKNKYEKLVNMIICKMLLEKENLDDILYKLGLIIKQIETNNLNSEELNDKTIYNDLIKHLNFDYSNISNEFAEKGFKNFVYKHIIPNAILNDEKGHFYTSTELEYIANLRYNLNEIKNLEIEYNDFLNVKYDEITINEIRRTIKRKIELTIIMFFLANINLRPDYIKKYTDVYDLALKIEGQTPAGLYLNSYCSILYSMAYGKDDFRIQYNGIMSPFCFIDNIKPLLNMI